MDKPEFCEGWFGEDGFVINSDGAWPVDDSIYTKLGFVKRKFRITCDEAGDVIRLERVEE